MLTALVGHWAKEGSWPYEAARAFDVLGNALLWRDDIWARNQTISEHAAIAARLKRRSGCVVCSFLNFIATNHCENSLGASLEPVEVSPATDLDVQ